MVLTDSMKFRQARISLADSHVVAMHSSLPDDEQMLRAQVIVMYNDCCTQCNLHCDRSSPQQTSRSFQCRQSTDLTPGTWTVDPSHSTIGFVARHLMVSKVRGHFAAFSGTLTIAE